METSGKTPCCAIENILQNEFKNQKLGRERSSVCMLWK